MRKELDDKQIESAAKSVKALLLGYAQTKDEAHKISDKIDDIEKDLKILNRLTNGKFGEFVNGLYSKMSFRDATFER